MITPCSPQRMTEVALSRRFEKALLRQARGLWVGTRRGLKVAVRRYVRRYRNEGGLLREALFSPARAAAIALLALQLYAAPVQASAPAFVERAGADNPLGYVQAYNGAPAFGDLDGDGDLDLVYGENNYNYGVFRYFENVGGAGAPAFVDRVGVNNPLGQVYGRRSIPALVDLDADGDVDLVSGDYYGTFRYIENTGSTGVPAFVQRTGTDNPLDGADVGYRAAPSFVDLDGDGDLDLISGKENGLFVYFENTGDVFTPAFVQRGGPGNPLNGADAGSHSAPAFGDLDFDGDLDLVSGDRYGAFFYFENTGSSLSPAFVERAGTNNPLDGAEADNRTTPSFVDLDADGDLDLVSGGGNQFFYFQNTTPPPAVFGAAQTNPFGLGDVGFLSAPSFVDLDGDGDFDLVSGGLLGALVYFENTGSASAPAFVAHTGAENPLDGHGVGYRAAPSFGDLDGDGDLDVISGDYYGAFFYFENTGSASAPAFVAHTGAENPLDGADVGRYSAPSFVDLDADGDFDLVSGEDDGAFFYFANTGSSISPAFSARTGSDNPLDGVGVGSYSAPAFVDLDGDGDLDMISGDSYYGVFFYFENTGSLVAPAFVARTGAENPLDGADVGRYSTPSLGDLDADGDFDLISGVNSGAFVYFENTTPPPLPPEPPPEPATLDIATVFVGPGDTDPPVEVLLTNSGPDSVAALQFDIDLSGVDHALLGAADDILGDAVDDDGSPVAGFEIQGNLLNGGNTLRVVLSSPTGAVIPPGEAPVLVARLYYIAGANLGVEEPLDFEDGSIDLSDPDTGDIPAVGTGGAIQTGIVGDATLDGQVRVHDLVALIAGLIGRAGFVTPTDPDDVLFKIYNAAPSVEGPEVITVADAIGIVNLILEIDFTKPVAGEMSLALSSPVTLSGGQTAIPVTVEGPVAGLEATITFDPSLVAVGTPFGIESGNLLVDSRVDKGTLRLVAVGLTAQGLPSGEPALYIPVSLLTDAEVVLTVSRLTLADRSARSVQIAPNSLSQSVSKGAATPRAFALTGNRPNPFNPATQISYEVPQQAHISLIVYNLLGQEVARLVDGVKPAGRYTATWDGRNAAGQVVSSGVYVYRLTSSTGYGESRRMTLLK